MTNEQLVASYTGLLIIEYSNPDLQPNAIATIDLLATEGIANQVVGQVLSGFSLTGIYGQSIAQGTQLDILGQFVGAVRSLPNYSPSILFFGMQDTTGSFNPDAGGYGDGTSSIPPTDYWDSTNQSEAGTYILSDSQMIQLIEYLATVNNANYTVAEIDNILFQFFGIFATMTETGPMHLTYTESSSDPGTLFGIVNYLNAFPHPAGNEITVVPA